MEVEQQQEADELDQSLIPRKRNLHQTPFSTNNSSTFDGEMSSSSSVDGEEWKQQGEDEVVQDFIQQNGIKIDEDETEKEKQEYCVYYDTDKAFNVKQATLLSVTKTVDCLDRIATSGFQYQEYGNVESARGIVRVERTGLHGESSANGIDSTAHEKNHLQENTNVASHNQENGNGLYHVVNNQNAEHQNQNAEHQKHDEFSDGNLQPSEISFDKSSPSYINIETESSDIEVIKDVENEITEFDVETVLKKQDTHDLYCPNCNSCITKRVILRKRKRRIPAPGEDAKRNKSETPIPSQVNVVSSNSQAQNGSELSLDDVQPPASNEYDHQIEPDVFRCLSCFSIFMPTGTGFKLFRMFGNKSDEENNQRSQKQVGVKKHWFSSIFASDKVDQSNNEDQVQSAPSSTQESVTIEQVNAEESNNTNIGRIADTHDQLLTSYHIDSNAKSDYPGMFVVMPPANNNSNNGEPTDDDISSLQHDGLRLVVPPNVGSLIIDNSQMNQELDVTVQMNTSAESTNTMSEERTVQNNVEIHLEQPLKDVLTDKQIKVEELKKNESIEGKDTVITIDSKQLDPSSHQRSPGETGTSALQHVESGSQQGDATTLTGGRSLEIVKSMVYGGLMESIASLSVVSSAAGANADTLNVLALGLANIFGGLFLWDLKAERTRGSSEDRYQQLLGRRADFALHMVVCLLSYLVFGFLPPVVYGFSFRESNNRDLKLVMVAAASVICIMILAAGKAYVQNKSYFKTIAYYVTFGFMVSGASYLFGDLIVKLLEKMGIFHSGSVVNLVSIHGMNSKPALATF
ncbi:protein of unknown function DUF125, transmembrane [Cynara cardunculus var. scolymus]|uniref:Membrane protein of ER body-like protein n=1 Tax=Cynara cardunculus var. scolymus TaxID=59895 RepID=A0A103XT86_CYNCS|nr:protein of unknown function DUF125, transmembrane [Cynara cardunculus var. scolymus]